MFSAFRKSNSFISYLVVFIITVSLFNVYPPVKKAEAATFTFKTGTYVGDGTDNRTITGLGFQPDLVIIKDDNASGGDGLIMKTSSMAAEISVPLAEAEANLNSSNIQSLDADGFTIGSDTDVNTANIIYYWVAFGGSDCSASGTLCVGTYTGTGTSQNITSVGFQPDLVMVKRSGVSQGVWRSSVMGANISQYFSTTAQTTSQRITSFLSNGFVVGNNAEVNSNTNTYYFVAFKEVNDFLNVGTYTGNGADNRAINNLIDPDLDFQPDFVWVKRTATSAGVGSIREHAGDRSFIGTDGNSVTNAIQRLVSTGGFQVGTSASTNTNGSTYFYFAFGGAANHNQSSSGTFRMAQGIYTGTGSAFSLTGIPFASDLVIVKGDTTQYGVFKTKIMTGNWTAYLAAALTWFVDGIISLNADGFSVGTSAVTNTNGVTYHWVAYGNASRLDKAGGASDFFIGKYVGTGSDDSQYIDLGIRPDVLVIKRIANTIGAFRTPEQTGDTTLFFSTDVGGANRIQDITATSFEKGTAAEVNTSGSYYEFFAFSTGDRLTTGTYTGTGSAQDITTATFQPDYVWVKSDATAAGVHRTSDAPGDFVLPFINDVSVTDRMTNLILNGFSVGTGVGTNGAGQNYTYVAWNAKEYTQQAYRWFTNTDSTGVGSSLGLSNTSVTVLPTSPVRLRMLMRVDIGNLFTDAEEFNLQVAPKVGTCDTSFTGETYADASGSNFFNNPTPAHGAALTVYGDDPTDGVRTITNQTYNEQNPISPGVGSTLDGQTAKFDFSLNPVNVNPGDYCLRMVYSDGSLLESYAQIPEITVLEAPQEISFVLSDNTIGFGELSSTASRWATGDTNGSVTNQTAHTLTASTNAGNGYIVQLTGSTLTANLGTDTIAVIGGVATPSVVGTEQFGLRITSTGTGTVSAPYNTTDYAFDSAAFPDIVATGPGDNTDTTYSMMYIANISGSTEAGAYQTALTYTVTANY